MKGMAVEIAKPATIPCAKFSMVEVYTVFEIIPFSLSLVLPEFETVLVPRALPVPAVEVQV